MSLVLIILLVLLLVGGIPTITRHEYGYGPSGVIGLLLVVLLVLVLVGYRF